MEYKLPFQVRWADTDPSGHMRHSAYNDYGAHVRVAALSQGELPIIKLMEMQIGPVAFREEMIFKHELRLLGHFEVNLSVSAMRKNGKIWTMKHEFILPSGKIAATITIDGGWLHLIERKVVPPPEELFKTMDSIPKTPDFVWLPDKK